METETYQMQTRSQYFAFLHNTETDSAFKNSRGQQVHSGTCQFSTLHHCYGLTADLANKAALLTTVGHQKH